MEFKLRDVAPPGTLLLGSVSDLRELRLLRRVRVYTRPDVSANARKMIGKRKSVL